MRRLSILIDESRSQTDNVEISSDTGIPDKDFIQAANSAQDRIFAKILQAHAEVFLATKVVAVVPQQYEYSIPSDCYLGVRLERLEHSRDGSEQSYRELTKNQQYRRRATTVRLRCPLDAGVLRFEYQKAVPRLDISRGKVLTATYSGGGALTALTLDPNSSIDFDNILSIGKICTVDADGDITTAGIPITAIDQTTGDCTLGTFTPQAGEVINVGDDVVLGKYATTISQLPDTCERYLLALMNAKANHRDSSNDELGTVAEVQEIEDEIVASFSEPDMAVDYIPLINHEHSDW